MRYSTHEAWASCVSLLLQFNHNRVTVEFLSFFDSMFKNIGVICSKMQKKMRFIIDTLERLSYNKYGRFKYVMQHVNIRIL